jgi:mono/diheme cytochrome c family protein
MISARMRRAPKLLLMSAASISLAALATACGTERVSVSKSQAQLYHGAVLFQQRCSGCHTLSYAATHGSAASVRTAEFNNGPNFDVRCERPIARVLYAIENGGFSGAIMPQNVVVGQDAADVARFVATYAGRKSPNVPGVPTCTQKPVGAIPPPSASTATTGASGPTGPASTATTGTTGPAKALRAKAKRPAKRKP